jgi:hypothetical protein
MNAESITAARRDDAARSPAASGAPVIALANPEVGAAPVLGMAFTVRSDAIPPIYDAKVAFIAVV